MYSPAGAEGYKDLAWFVGRGKQGGFLLGGARAHRKVLPKEAGARRRTGRWPEEEPPPPCFGADPNKGGGFLLWNYTDVSPFIIGEKIHGRLRTHHDCSVRSVLFALVTRWRRTDHTKVMLRSTPWGPQMPRRWSCRIRGRLEQNGLTPPPEVRICVFLRRS